MVAMVEKAAPERQHREDEEDEEEAPRPIHEGARNDAETEDGGHQSDDEEHYTQTNGCA
jgi:hypothetical protein